MCMTVAAGLLWSGVVSAQEMPSEYKTVLTTLGKSGDFKEGVLKVNIPRNDLRVTIKQKPTPTPFGFGGWIALTKGEGGHEVMMGDLVLTEDEVNPVMSAILDNGLDVTALHNHFFWEQPRIFYMHVHGMGSAADLTRRVKPAIDLNDQSGKRAAAINSRMGLNTWVAFTGTDADAIVAGDVAMLEHEVTSVLKALRGNGLDVVAIHHHMTDVQPVVIFLHYYGTGPAAKLAQGVRAAVDLLGNAAASRQ
jgi:hypothetical protein